ncbi:winged helix-turn-helix transcriptional regulator [Paenibacillus sp. JX-17]|uniref:Winged helix-turn-helix transcriptional regulator n=1 Tax=Paenibacillus lacisoli TaxID=3064525 RepID=A0ABT9CE24_9BACL|nr:winged helix-turn-helix transcriptional regulator [Paenibacillus sp. JX-17]MDO7907492.1 winged helix-turn-helix transcriptional regulator [Paenibacillus sp. JX-17]
MKTFYCDLEITLDVIGGKWRPLILYYLIKSPKRTSELKRLIPSISQKMLIQSLRELESNHLIIRKMYNQVPPKVEYEISEIGMSLEPTLRALCDWGQNYAEKTLNKDEYQRLNVE